MPRAVLNGTVLAESDHTVVVEGNHYFPPESVRRDNLTASRTKTLCPWKGRASYHNAEVGGEKYANVGWYYPRPSPLARRIRGHVAFDPGVRIEPTDHDQPRPKRRLGDVLRGRGRQSR